MKCEKCGRNAHMLNSGFTKSGGLCSECAMKVIGGK